MSESSLIKDIVFEIARVATKLEVAPSMLTKTQFLKESEINEWQLRKVGGFSAILKTYFPQDDRDLKSIEVNKQRAAYVRKLEKIVGSRDAFQEHVTSSISQIVSQIKIEPIQLDKRATQAYLKGMLSNTASDSAPRSLVSLWSDQHYGTNVDKEELGGKNEFNWDISARRLGMLCDQLVTYKVEKRNLHEELVVLLIGDNIAGVIHGLEGYGSDLWFHQIAGTTYYYVQALNYLKNFFPKIRVICQPGNHGRVQHQVSKDRALEQKFNSYENNIFYSLSLIFANDPQVFISATKAPYSDVIIQGHRIFTTHGDTMFETGNVGKKIDIQRIENQIHKINAEELDKARKPYELFATGHVHHPLITQVGPGIKLVINGCLVGTDAYAQAVGIHSSSPVQIVWECTRSFVQGDSRFIYVGMADEHNKYEKIIKPYQYELVAPKLI